MHQLTNLIDDIRTALTYSELVSPEKMADYAQQYADECTKLNDRLKKCLPYIREGNIAEAARLAEMPPNIIETFNLLDFMGRQDWIGICEEFDFDVPPPLAINLFQELNDAYLQMASLKPLMELQRFHALNGSPLRYRLAVLRSLAKADPMNLTLQNDQETFERARLEEMKQDIAEALDNKDAVQLQELYRELIDPGWRINPPKEFRQRICVAVLERQADELIQHFSAFDAPKAAAVYQSMQGVMRAGQMQKMPVPVEKSVQAAVEWLQETEDNAENLTEFQEAVEELRESLEDYTPREELESLYYTLQNTAAHANQSIPRELETYYRSRIDHLTRVERNRFRLVATGILAVIILVGVVILYAQWQQAHEKAEVQTLERLQNLKAEIANDRNAVDKIESTLKSISAKMSRSPKIAPPMNDLRGMLDEDNKRAKEFESVHVRAGLLMEQNPDLEGLKDVERLLKQADTGKLARKNQEINLLADLRSAYTTRQTQVQAGIDNEFREVFTGYSKEYNALPRSANKQYSSDELIKRLQMLAEKVGDLLGKHQHISEGLKLESNRLLGFIDNQLISIRQLQRDDDSKFKEQFGKHSQAFNLLLRSANNQFSPDVLIDRLQALEKSVHDLLEEYPNISDEQRQAGNGLRTSIENRLKLIQQAQAQAEADREFSSQLSVHKQAFNTLPRLPNNQFPPDVLIDQLQTLEKNVQNLLEEYPSISDEQRQAGTALLASTESRLGQVRTASGISSIRNALNSFFQPTSIADEQRREEQEGDNLQDSLEDRRQSLQL